MGSEFPKSEDGREFLSTSSKGDVYLEEVFVPLLDGLLPDLARVLCLTDILSVTILTLTPALAPGP